MLKKLLKKDEGFTLIEVVIVLAIAALIILVVLQAVSAAQRANRDNTRKQEASRVVSWVTEWESNNNGYAPTTFDSTTTTTGCSTSTKFCTSDYDTKNGSGQFTIAGKYQSTTQAEAATFTAPTCPTPGPNSYQMIYQPAGAAGSSARDFFLAVCLEAGGYDQVK